ncbi:MAG: Tetratricopeptide repeat protein [Pseudomonadota bacterium]|nr:Tetratricopeptide repeat protein [Pseudomonadota bacterium]
MRCIEFAALVAVATLLTGCVSGSASRPLPYLREQGDFFMQAGIESYNQYNFALANEQFTHAKNFYGRFDDYLGATHALLNLVQTNLAWGKPDEAASNLARADQLIQQHKLQSQAIYRDLLLSTLYLEANQSANAEKILTVHDLLMRSNTPDDTAMALLVNRVRLAQITDQDFTQWLNLFAQQNSKHNNAELAARLQRFNAWQAFLNNDSAQGNQFFETALNSYRERADPPGLMSTRLEWAQASARTNDWPQAVTHYEQALHLAMANNHVPNGLRALEGLRAAYPQAGQQQKLPQVDEWMNQLEKLSVNKGNMQERK